MKLNSISISILHTAVVDSKPMYFLFPDNVSLFSSSLCLESGDSGGRGLSSTPLSITPRQRL